MVFAHSILSMEKIYDLKYFWFCSKIRIYKLNFMYLGVLGEYGKILLAFSPFALTYFLRILRINTHVAENCTVVCETFDV
jgi:hypothetical protein